MVRAVRRLAQVSYRLIENDNYDMRANGELRVLDVLAKHAQVRTVFDVGANVGEYSVAAAQAFPEAAIYSFEPVKETFDRLATRLAGFPRAAAFNFGLSDRDEAVDFSVQPGDLTNSTSHPTLSKMLNPDAARITVRCQLRNSGAAAGEIGVPCIDLLKIDTEGNDWFVLNGFADWLAEGRIKTIQFEYGLTCISTRRLLLDHYALLTKHGYRVGKIFPKFVDFRDYNPLDEDFIGPNFLAVHETTGFAEFLK